MSKFDALWPLALMITLIISVFTHAEWVDYLSLCIFAGWFAVIGFRENQES